MQNPIVTKENIRLFNYPETLSVSILVVGSKDDDNQSLYLTYKELLHLSSLLKEALDSNRTIIPI